MIPFLFKEIMTSWNVFLPEGREIGNKKKAKFLLTLQGPEYSPYSEAEDYDIKHSFAPENNI